MSIPPPVDPPLTPAQLIENRVDEILASANITYRVTNQGVDEITHGHPMDQWTVWFTRAVGGASTKTAASFCEGYYTGLGHRKLPKMQQGWARRNRQTMGTREYMRWVQEESRPVAPRAAGVLYCLLRDAAAVNMSHADWCMDFGYDRDSIKADALYKQCVDIGLRLRSLFGFELQDTLRTVLEDY